jgi:carnitine O-palmitoyltransferase 2
VRSKSFNLDSLFFSFLSLQIGIYRQKGRFVPTYESCSTAAFRHGRTETIRSASNATVACSEAFDKSHRAGVDEMMSRIKQATDWHGKLTKEAAMGKKKDHVIPRNWWFKTIPKEIN